VSAGRIHWLLRGADEVPAGDGWLSEEERAVQQRLRFEKRRADWRLGRWTAKVAVGGLLEVADPAGVTIRAGQDGAPVAIVRGAPADVRISLSHSGGRALCAVAPHGVAVGCDLETVEPRDDGFVADYFTRTEMARVTACPAEARDEVITVIWSSKESALKALRTGLRADTRWVEVSPADGSRGDHEGWAPITVHHVDGAVLRGWWRRDAGAVVSVVADGVDEPPVRMA
jgi:4'-phosphopantetheinyl transferase